MSLRFMCSSLVKGGAYRKPFVGGRTVLAYDCAMTRMTAALGIVLLLIGSAAAQSDGDAFKKTEKGFGELLRGMGQELRKFGGSLSGGTKKDAKKEATKDEAAK
jgi:hypothetical protein